MKQVKSSKKVQARINSCPTSKNDENQVFIQILRDLVFKNSPPGFTFQKGAIDALKAASAMYVDQFLEDKERGFDKIDPAVLENLIKENNSKLVHVKWTEGEEEITDFVNQPIEENRGIYFAKNAQKWLER